MKKLAEFIYKFKFFIIALFLLFIFGISSFIKNIRVETDMLNYLPPENKYVKIFKEVGKKFGANYMVLIALETDNVFKKNFLYRMGKLTENLQKIKGVRDVFSLTKIIDIKKTEDGIEVADLIADYKKLPDNKEYYERLRKYVLSKDMYVGSFVTEDGKVASIVAKIYDKPHINKMTVAKKISDLVEKEFSGHKYYISGMPKTMEFMQDAIFKDMSTLTPFISLIIIFILFVSFRSVGGVVLPLLTVLFSTMIAFGLMALFHRPITMITAIMPVILISNGTAYGIHLLNRYLEIKSKLKDKKEVIKETLKTIGIPIIVAALTTFVGFLSLVTSTMVIFRDFGIFTSIGIVFAVIFSIVFIPAVLSIGRRKKKGNGQTKGKNSTNNENGKNRGAELSSEDGDKNNNNKQKGYHDTILSRFFAFLGEKTIKFRKPIIGFVIVTMIVTAILAINLSTEVNLLEYFKKDSFVRISYDYIADKFGGSTAAVLDVKGDIKNPVTLKIMHNLNKKLDSIQYINNVSSISTLLSEINFVLNGKRRVPDTKQGVGNLWVFIEGNDVLDQMLLPNNKEGIIQGQISVSDTERLDKINKKVQEFLNKIPSELYTVSKEDIKDPGKQWIFANKMFNQIIKKIKLDLINSKKLTKDEALKIYYDFSTKEFSKIFKPGLEGFTDFYDYEEKPLKEELINYMKSDDSEIEFSDDQLEKLKKYIHSHHFNKNFMEGLEKLILSFEDVEKEDVSSLVSSLNGIVLEKKKEAVVNRYLNLLPGKEKLDSTTLENIVGDLYDSFSPYIIVNKKTYRELTGKDPDPKTAIKIKVEDAGMGPVLVDLKRGLTRSQLQSLLVAFILVFFMVSIEFKSINGGIFGMIPISFTILFNFGVMRLLNIPLDDSTMMIASIGIGIGIDYVVHFLHRFNKEVKLTNDLKKAYITTITTTGKAIFINASAVFSGFIILILSEIVSIQRFGWLTAMTMFLSVIGSMTILPAFLITFKPKFLYKNKSKQSNS